VAYAWLARERQREVAVGLGGRFETFQRRLLFALTCQPDPSTQCFE
jgi:hypothetical protein